MKNKIGIFQNFVKRLFSSGTINTLKNNDIKRFNEIPGPKGILNFGTIFNYLPMIGTYSWDHLHIAGFKKYQQYGKIVREKILPGVYVIWLYDPNDIATVLNDSGPGNYPRRQSHLALEKYRKDRPKIYRTGGLLPTNGAEWWNIRSELQKCLSSPTHVRHFLPLSDQITIDFVERINLNLNNDDFLQDLSRLNLELVCLLAFGMKMNSFSEEEMKIDSRTTKLIASAEISNGCILPTDQGFKLWRLFETNDYRTLRQAQQFMENVALDIIAEKLERNEINSESKTSLLDFYLNNPKLEMRDIIGMVCDLLLAGVDTTSYATSFLLYHLCKNEHVQDKLFNESLTVLPNACDKMTTAILNSEIPYARAVLKESLRLNPISVGVGRILNHDLILSNYNVPKGTVAVTQNLVACRLEENFESPEKFQPERWLKIRISEKSTEKRINPYLVLPFGHGMRACIARRLAEQNMLIFIIRLIRNFKLEWTGDERLEFETKLINKPKQNIKIKFIKREIH